MITDLGSYTFSSAVTAAFAVVALFVCLAAWLIWDDQQAKGYVIPVLYFAILYFVFTIDPSIDDLTRRFWVRPGICGILTVVIIMRGAFISRKRSRDKSDAARRNRSNR